MHSNISLLAVPTLLHEGLLSVDSSVISLGGVRTVLHYTDGLGSLPILKYSGKNKYVNPLEFRISALIALLSIVGLKFATPQY